MGTVKKGTLVKPVERWAHMDWMKGVFWGRTRAAEKRLIESELEDLEEQDELEHNP